MISSTKNPNPLSSPNRSSDAARQGGQRNNLRDSGYSSLPGRGHPPAGDLFVCPKRLCGYKWTRHFVDDKVPKCPTHNVKLVPSGLSGRPVSSDS